MIQHKKVFLHLVLNLLKNTALSTLCLVLVLGNFLLCKVLLSTWTGGIFSQLQLRGPAGEWPGWRWVL